MITSVDNARVKQARALLERRGRQQHGQCLAEGTRLIEDAMRAGVRPALVFLSEGAEEVAGPRDVAERARSAGIPVWELSRTVFASLSDTTTSQGIIAVLPVPSLPPPVEPSLVLIVDQVRDPGNLGTILRSADAAGADLVLLLRGCADAWSPKVLRAGMGAHFRLAMQTSLEWPQVTARVEGRAVWLADARGEHIYDRVDWTVPSGLIVNGETTGASDEAQKICTGRVAIPMMGAAESLNVAMAATVLLFEAVRQRRRAAAR